MTVFDIDWSKYRIIDLSFEVVPGASQDRYFEIERGLLADNAYMHHVRTHTHVGTHVEVDAHFFDGGRDVPAYPLTAFMGRGLLVDVPNVAETPELTAAYLDAKLGQLIGTGDIILCRNSDPVSKTPGGPRTFLSPEAGEWFVAHRVKMVGVDARFGLGRTVPNGRALHDIFMRAGGTFIEFLDNLQEIRRPEFYFMALPFKARAIDSSWARAVAIEEI